MPGRKPVASRARTTNDLAKATAQVLRGDMALETYKKDFALSEREPCKAAVLHQIHEALKPGSSYRSNQELLCTTLLRFFERNAEKNKMHTNAILKKNDKRAWQIFGDEVQKRSMNVTPAILQAMWCAEDVLGKAKIGIPAPRSKVNLDELQEKIEGLFQDLSVVPPLSFSELAKISRDPHEEKVLESDAKVIERRWVSTRSMKILLKYSHDHVATFLLERRGDIPDGELKDVLMSVFPREDKIVKDGKASNKRGRAKSSLDAGPLSSIQDSRPAKKARVKDSSSRDSQPLSNDDLENLMQFVFNSEEGYAQAVDAGCKVCEEWCRLNDIQRKEILETCQQNGGDLTEDDFARAFVGLLEDLEVAAQRLFLAKDLLDALTPKLPCLFTLEADIIYHGYSGAALGFAFSTYPCLCSFIKGCLKRSQAPGEDCRYERLALVLDKIKDKMTKMTSRLSEELPLPEGIKDVVKNGPTAASYVQKYWGKLPEACSRSIISIEDSYYKAVRTAVMLQEVSLALDASKEDQKKVKNKIGNLNAHVVQAAEPYRRQLLVEAMMEAFSRVIRSDNVQFEDEKAEAAVIVFDEVTLILNIGGEVQRSIRTHDMKKIHQMVQERITLASEDAKMYDAAIAAWKDHKATQRSDTVISDMDAMNVTMEAMKALALRKRTVLQAIRMYVRKQEKMKKEEYSSNPNMKNESDAFLLEEIYGHWTELQAYWKDDVKEDIKKPPKTSATSLSGALSYYQGKNSLQRQWSYPHDPHSVIEEARDILLLSSKNLQNLFKEGSEAVLKEMQDAFQKMANDRYNFRLLKGLQTLSWSGRSNKKDAQTEELKQTFRRLCRVALLENYVAPFDVWRMPLSYDVPLKDVMILVCGAKLHAMDFERMTPEEGMRGSAAFSIFMLRHQKHLKIVSLPFHISTPWLLASLDKLVDEGGVEPENIIILDMFMLTRNTTKVQFMREAERSSKKKKEGDREDIEYKEQQDFKADDEEEEQKDHEFGRCLAQNLDSLFQLADDENMEEDSKVTVVTVSRKEVWKKLARLEKKRFEEILQELPSKPVALKVFACTEITPDARKSLENGCKAVIFSPFAPCTVRQHLLVHLPVEAATQEVCSDLKKHGIRLFGYFPGMKKLPYDIRVFDYSKDVTTESGSLWDYELYWRSTESSKSNVAQAVEKAIAAVRDVPELEEKSKNSQCLFVDYANLPWSTDDSREHPCHVLFATPGGRQKSRRLAELSCSELRRGRCQQPNCEALATRGCPLVLRALTHCEEHVEEAFRLVPLGESRLIENEKASIGISSALLLVKCCYHGCFHTATYAFQSYGKWTWCDEHVKCIKESMESHRFCHTGQRYDGVYCDCALCKQLAVQQKLMHGSKHLHWTPNQPVLLMEPSPYFQKINPECYTTEALLRKRDDLHLNLEAAEVRQGLEQDLSTALNDWGSKSKMKLVITSDEYLRSVLRGIFDGVPVLCIKGLSPKELRTALESNLVFSKELECKLLEAIHKNSSKTGENTYPPISHHEEYRLQSKNIHSSAHPHEMLAIPEHGLIQTIFSRRLKGVYALASPFLARLRQILHHLGCLDCACLVQLPKDRMPEKFTVWHIFVMCCLDVAYRRPLGESTSEALIVQTLHDLVSFFETLCLTGQVASSPIPYLSETLCKLRAPPVRQLCMDFLQELDDVMVSYLTDGSKKKMLRGVCHAFNMHMPQYTPCGLFLKHFRERLKEHEMITVNLNLDKKPAVKFHVAIETARFHLKTDEFKQLLEGLKQYRVCIGGEAFEEHCSAAWSLRTAAEVAAALQPPKMVS